jgi:hypothetical protein
MSLGLSWDEFGTWCGKGLGHGSFGIELGQSWDRFGTELGRVWERFGRDLGEVLVPMTQILPLYYKQPLHIRKITWG